MQRASSDRSFKAIRDSKVLGRRRFQTYDVISVVTLAGQDITQMEAVREVQRRFGSKIPDHSITNRFAELENLKVIMVLRERRCTSVIGKVEVMAYVSTDYVPTKSEVRALSNAEPKDKQIARLTKELGVIAKDRDFWRKHAQEFARSIVDYKNQITKLNDQKEGLDAQLRHLNLELDKWREISVLVSGSHLPAIKVLERVRIMQFEFNNLKQRLNDYDRSK